MIRKKSVTAAKERLKGMLRYEDNLLDEDTIHSLQNDIRRVVVKYVDAQPEDIEIKVILKEYKKRETECLNSTN